ncbi:MAG: hypothetical protein ACK51N_00255 [bacterium]|nr:hypothetical protein [Phycisphaerales bacterium]MCE2653432.1 hypothetical protein [Planctomycetaceae bacterium]
MPIDSSDLRTVLGFAVAGMQTAGEACWNCYAVGWRPPTPAAGDEGLALAVREPSFEKYTELTCSDGYPDGTIMYWCCAVGRLQIASLAVEVHLRNDLVRELAAGCAWLNVAPPIDVHRMPCIEISFEKIQECRQFAQEQETRQGWLKKFKQLIRRATSGGVRGEEHTAGGR